MSGDRQAAPPSPCVDVCELDSDDICRGCYRTLDEIGDWPMLSAAARHRVVDAAALRRKRAGNGVPADTDER